MNIRSSNTSYCDIYHKSRFPSNYFHLIQNSPKFCLVQILENFLNLYSIVLWYQKKTTTTTKQINKTFNTHSHTEKYTPGSHMGPIITFTVLSLPTLELYTDRERERNRVNAQTVITSLALDSIMLQCVGLCAWLTILYFLNHMYHVH